MAEKLTPQQKMAVENRGGNLLVSAAAGSGKTKVLVDRLMSYLMDPIDPANLDDFLVITYTKAAASELRGKICDKLTQYISQNPDNRHMQQQLQRLYLAKVSTVHAFCADILREYAYRLDISADFRIAEENECQEMMIQVLNQLLNEAYSTQIDNNDFRAFVDTQGLGRDDRQVPEIILQIYSSALCHLDPEKWLDWCVSACDFSQVTDVSETIWGKYLVDDLKQFLDLQIRSLQNCIVRASALSGMEKPTTLLSATVNDLKSLYTCETWDQIARHPGVSYGTLTFKKEHKGTQLAEQIKAIRNHCKETLPKKLRAFSDDSRVILGHLQDSSAACAGLVALVKEFRHRYDGLKKTRRVLDFSDIEQKTLDLLLGKQRTGSTSAAIEIGKRFREIMVDEYQDSNEVQDAIFAALTLKRQNCFMVGDVKQSIYRFRLADPDIFLNKYHNFSSAVEATDGVGRKVLLSSNFRSSGGVIDAVNDVFSICMSDTTGGLAYTENEHLREGIPHIPLVDPEVELYGVCVREDTYEEEASVVAQRIYQLLDGTHMVRQGDVLRPITPDDIVILLRSPGSVGGEFLYALGQWGIPCFMGNDADLLQTPEVDTLRSILQIIHNPLQDIPLISAMLSPVFGFSADDMARIRAPHRKGYFYHAVKKSGTQKAESFLNTLSVLRKRARFLTVTQLLHQIFLQTDILSIYGAMPDGDDRIQNLHCFCQIASDFENTGRKGIEYFLQYLDALQQRGFSISSQTVSGAVRIMSIHKSKGLEFPVVFLCGLSRGFNMADVQKPVLCHKDLGLGLSVVNTQHRVRFPSVAKRAIAAKITADSISEELRVLYVAMTRAKDRLIMTYASANLEDRLKEIVYRMDLSEGELLNGHVTNPGTWVLRTALARTEASEFFQLAGYPDQTCVSSTPWAIHVVQAPTACGATKDNVLTQDGLSREMVDKMRKGLSYSYAYSAASQIPSKMTATQLKGRFKDQEVAENTIASTMQRTFRKPSPLYRICSGVDYGNVLHAVMQYLDFHVCTGITEISAEITRMENAGLISHEQASAVDTQQIYAFLSCELGRMVQNASHVLREFKFSIMDDAGKYYQGIEEETILLQGVVDCAVIEDDGITIIDFKTDRVTLESLTKKAAYYTPQVTAYANALSRIYGKKVKAAYLYFFCADTPISVL